MRARAVILCVFPFLRTYNYSSTRLARGDALKRERERQIKKTCKKETVERVSYTRGHSTGDVMSDEKKSQTRREIFHVPPA